MTTSEPGASVEATPIKRQGLRGWGSGDAARRHLKNGFPVYIGDRRFPGKLIQLHPDGRREFVTLDDDDNVIVLGPVPED